MKRFLVDDTVFLASPHALMAFDDNEVILSSSVIASMGEHAKGHGETRANAAEFMQLLDSIYDVPGEKVIPLGNGGALQICNDEDHTIFQLADQQNAIIVSRDPAVRVQARALGLATEPFKAEQTKPTAQHYMGRCNLYVPPAAMQAFAVNEYLTPDISGYYATSPEGQMLAEDYHLTVNEYVTLVNNANPDAGTMLGRFDGKNIVPLIFYHKDHPVYGVTARNVGQMFALDALMNPEAALVILQGPAGTAKTFLSMAAGLQMTLEDKLYRRILVTRPNTKMDNDVGFLKGDEKEKVLPTLRGLLDNVDNLMPNASRNKDGFPTGSLLDDLIERGTIEAQAMAYMRGRSITRQYMVVDEMQNSTQTQALSVITRIGEQSKIVLLGDPDQIDSPYLDRRNNGLVYAAEGMKGSPHCFQLTFMEKESTRSPLAKDALSRLCPKGTF